MAKTPAAPLSAAMDIVPQSRAPMFIVVGLCALNLLLSSVIAIKVLTAGAPGHGKAAAKEEKPPGNVPGPVITMDTFVVNLNEPSSSRYLKATFEIEVVDAAAQKELEDQRRPLRDDVLRYLSNLTIKDTLGEAGKQRIKEDLTERADKAIGGHGKVKHLFFTEFVVQ